LDKQNGNYDFFANKGEDPASSIGAMSQAEIADGLKNAMDNWRRINQTFGSFNEKCGAKRRKKRTTIPVSPKLHTRTRLGKTRQEEEGEKLRKRRQQIFNMAVKPRWA